MVSHFMMFLAGNNDQLVHHINAAINALDEDKHEEFSIYTNEIKSHRPKLEKRQVLFDECLESLFKISTCEGKIYKGKFQIAFTKIAGLLSNVEIENLNEAVRGQHT